MRQARTILALAALLFLVGCALFSTGLESVDLSAYPARAATETAAVRAATPAFLPGGRSTPTIARISGVSGAAMPPSADVRIAPQCSRFDPPGDDDARLNDEYVCLRNVGTTPVDLGAWRVTDAARHVYRFAPRLLPAGASLRLHTGPGVDTATDVYWGQPQAVWDNDGDTVTLYVRGGAQIDEYTYRR